jgi:uncharacterized membrane protein YccF (DUF307 family)
MVTRSRMRIRSVVHHAVVHARSTKNKIARAALRWQSIRAEFQTLGTECAEAFFAKANAVNARFDVARFLFVISFGLFLAMITVFAAVAFAVYGTPFLLDHFQIPSTRVSVLISVEIRKTSDVT